MVKAVTAKFHEMVLEKEITPGSGTWEILCGLTSRSVDRAHNMDTVEVPDCANEALPLAVERDVRSTEVKVSGSGVWAVSSHEKIMDWFYDGVALNIRIQHVKAAVGDTEYETGPAFLVSLTNAVEKGQRVTAELEIEFDGIPTRTAQTT